MRRAVARLVRTLSTSPLPMLYCSRTHAWVQRLRCGTAVRVGLTERGLDDIGDVEAVEHIAVVGKSVARASALLRIDWEALRISDGDELYHTRWANVSGHHTLSAPIDGTVAAVNADALQRGRLGGVLDADEWLVEMNLTEDTDLGHLMSAEEYAGRVCTQGSGAFGETSESLTYTSYG